MARPLELILRGALLIEAALFLPHGRSRERTPRRYTSGKSSAAKMIREALNALIETHSRSPVERLMRRSGIEPVRGRQLLDQKSGDQRFPVEGGTNPLSDRAGGPRRGEGNRSNALADPGGSHDRGHDVAYCPGFTIADDEGPSTNTFDVCAFQGVHERLRRIVHVRGVDQRVTAVDDEQAAATRSIDDATDQLLVSRPPNQMRADSHDRHIRRVQHLLFCQGLRTRVVPARTRGICWIGVRPDQRAPDVGDRRGGYVDQAPDPSRTSSFEHHLSADHVRSFELMPLSLNTHSSGSMNHRTATHERALHHTWIVYRSQNVGNGSTIGHPRGIALQRYHLPTSRDRRLDRGVT